MISITKELSNEHQNILSVIHIVLDECNRIETGKAINNDFFTKVVGFIKKYADGYHHAKEENILFKTMLDSEDCLHCNPIPVMLHEHDAGRNFVVEMVRALDADNKTKLIESARGYCFLLENHIYKEDNILYPMAEDALNDSQKQQVIEQYDFLNKNDYFPTDINEFIEGLSVVTEK